MTSSAKEIWRDIPGYEGRYQASDMGRVRSVDRRVKICHGATRLMRGRILKPAGSRHNPHLYVVLGHGAHGSPVHQLVAAAFLGPRPAGYDTRHLDGNPLNNRADNLAYGTRTDNILDVLRIGQSWRGSCTIDQVREIRKRLADGETCAGIARSMGIKSGPVYHIKEGRTFKWLD